MDIKVCMPPVTDSVIIYQANPDEVANRGDSEEINLIFADIPHDAEGRHRIGIPSCSRDSLAEPTTALDREVYQKLVDEGALTANVIGAEIILYDHYSGNIPMVEFKCEVIGCGGYICTIINPFEPKDTPNMALFIWKAAVAKALEVANRFVELGKATKDSSKGEDQ